MRFIPVFSLPGRAETSAEAFSGLSWKRPVDIRHIDLVDPFARLSFSEQVDTVLRLVRQTYWEEEALLLGRSFGAWILLQALMRLETVYPGTVILLSAVLGYGQHRGLHFIAPRAASFWDEAPMHAVAPARRLTLLHAADDAQCPLTYARQLGRLWPLDLIVFERGGHDVGKRVLHAEVSEAIDRIWHPTQPGGKRSVAHD